MTNENKKSWRSLNKQERHAIENAMIDWKQEELATFIANGLIFKKDRKLMRVNKWIVVVMELVINGEPERFYQCSHSEDKDSFLNVQSSNLHRLLEMVFKKEVL